MQSQSNFWVLLDERKKSVVRMLITFLKDMLEIASRLVSMDDEDKMKRGTGLLHETHTP